MQRFFTLQEAEEVLPGVEAAIREAISLKTEYEEAEAEWHTFSQRAAVMGGVRMDRAQALEQKNRREAAAGALKQTIEKIQEFGCLVKDLDIGLIDFPTLYQGQEVYLCWKLGESGIRFWHGTHEGFRGRKPIDAEFLEHHQGGLRGELPN
jgi:hypothetical protein